ncbi:MULTISPECIES: arylsulfatase [unclassified Lentimonas]|uniref:sulfatase family protein n=1 Tax=unclassified Lentimonas TaxID=2630993 RepID=UPI00132958E5|nr:MULTISPECIES: arylsulfatase [unclassified Lentimonas]CAA6676272.1 Choline-sulfatase (EC [Lentimonas sp. CC4]CAA6683840.1 Choline-sulfatase (EC [Lentimonas sp. CC6]CAA7077763.1 Choline-sulfatase (EC [Lentimonas sp. CC4]CAA7169697.1 Choline-sulfatase (EC [Lentimonas sp. CC21]CAA7179518.1 Choline-sulfatase (EC [Lentimonas sp. CC8]
MKTIHILATLLTMIAALQAQAAKPNVVVIMADDIGLGDLSHYANLAGVEPVVETPNLDRLIGEGMSFTDAHSPASLCAPSRFSMMTGNYSYRNSRPWGVWGAEGSALIDPDFTTVARIAKAGGYHTAFFGKWGLGGSWLSKKQVDYTAEEAGPLSFGFDYAMALPQGIQSHPYAFYENREWVKFKPDSVLANVTHEHAGYEAPKPLGKGKKKSAKHRDYGGIGDSNWDPVLTGPMLVAKAVSYIDRQSAEEPFYMYYCSQAVHLPHTPPAELDGVKIAGSTAGVHGDMILELDVQVGMIVKALKAKGLYENTLLIFTSDNGGLSMTRGFNSSLELEGKKGSISEGGHRVPFVAVWPGKIQAGVVSAESIVGHDTVATIAALAEQPIDRSIVMDSTNLLPVFLGESEAPAHQYLMHQSKGGSAGPFYALREGAWKLVIKAENEKSLENLQPYALYHLEDNLSEDSDQNLLKNPEYRERTERMLKTYQDLRVSGAPTAVDR